MLGRGRTSTCRRVFLHRFSNPGAVACRFLVLVSPAGLEEYFAELAKLIAEEPNWPPADMGGVLALTARFDTFPPPVVP